MATYSDAAPICESIGASLATFAQLQEAQDLGVFPLVKFFFLGRKLVSTNFKICYNSQHGAYLERE